MVIWLSHSSSIISSYNILTSTCLTYHAVSAQVMKFRADSGNDVSTSVINDNSVL